MTLDNISARDCPTMGIKDPVRNFAVLSPRVSAVLKTAVLSVRIPKKTVARSDIENMTVFFIPFVRPLSRFEAREDDRPIATQEEPSGAIILSAKSIIDCADKNNIGDTPTATPERSPIAKTATKTGIKLYINTPKLLIDSMLDEMSSTIYGTQIHAKTSDIAKLDGIRSRSVD